MIDCPVVLVLSGGNALGAYQAGCYQALHDRGIRPAWVIGASTGAVNGAIICGSPEGERLERLARYWRVGTALPGSGTEPWWGGLGEELRRSTAVLTTLALGQHHVFAPRLLGSSWDPFSRNGQSSLYDTHPLAAGLEQMVDFERLNSDAPRYTATAVDLESGELIAFDTKRQVVGAEHIRASSALLPAFPPVEVDGRLLADGGFAANLPLDPVLADPPEGPLLCIAIDLLPLRASRPRTIGEAASRAQDLIFASQSHRTIAAWQAIYAARATEAAVTLLHLSYDRQEAEVAGKAFDYSPTSARARWDAGHIDLTHALDRLEDAALDLGQPGLTVWRPPAKA